MKNALITKGVYNEFLNFKKMLYLTKQDYNSVDSYIQEFGSLEIVKECFKIYNANRQRKKNNWNEIIKWYFAVLNLPSYKKYRLVFGTLTFDDKTLEKTSETTRRRYVSRFLNDKAIHYIANIDYGKENNREHYHFLAMIENDIPSEEWKYGYTFLEKIRLSNKDIKSSKNYLLKLNNHSYKESTRQQRILKDRHIDEVIDKKIPNALFFKTFKLELKYDY